MNACCSSSACYARVFSKPRAHLAPPTPPLLTALRPLHTFCLYLLHALQFFGSLLVLTDPLSENSQACSRWRCGDIPALTFVQLKLALDAVRFPQETVHSAEDKDMISK